MLDSAHGCSRAPLSCRYTGTTACNDTHANHGQGAEGGRTGGDTLRQQVQAPALIQGGLQPGRRGGLASASPSLARWEYLGGFRAAASIPPPLLPFPLLYLFLEFREICWWRYNLWLNPAIHNFFRNISPIHLLIVVRFPFTISRYRTPNETCYDFRVA